MASPSILPKQRIETEFKCQIETNRLKLLIPWAPLDGGIIWLGYFRHHNGDLRPNLALRCLLWVCVSEDPRSCLEDQVSPWQEESLQMCPQILLSSGYHWQESCSL